MSKCFISDNPDLLFLYSFMHEWQNNRSIFLSRVCLAFWVVGMNVNVTCLQALNIYPLARQALIWTYLCYHATDFDTFRTSCLILSIKTVLHFNVSGLQNACELCISSVPRDGSHLQPSVRWQAYLWYFLIVCYNTQAMPLFQVLNFLYVTSESKVFQMTSVYLENLRTPATECTCNSSIVKNLWKQHAEVYVVLVNWYTQNIQNL